MLVIGLGHGRCQIEQCRTTGDTHHNGLPECLRHAQGIEARRPLVGHRIARDVGTLVQVMYDGGIATAGTYHGMTDAMGHQQGGEDVD